MQTVEQHAKVPSLKYQHYQKKMYKKNLDKCLFQTNWLVSCDLSNLLKLVKNDHDNALVMHGYSLETEPSSTYTETNNKQQATF